MSLRLDADARYGNIVECMYCARATGDIHVP